MHFNHHKYAIDKFATHILNCQINIDSSYFLLSVGRYFIIESYGVYSITVHSKVRRVEYNRCYCVQCHWCCCCCSYWRCAHKHAHSSENCVSNLTEMNGSHMRHNNRLTGTHSNRSTIVKISFRWIFAFFSAIALHLNGILTEIVCFHSLQNPNWIGNTNVTSFPENKSSFFCRPKIAWCT